MDGLKVNEALEEIFEVLKDVINISMKRLHGYLLKMKQSKID